MACLILTRAGLDDLLAGGVASGARLHLRPGLAGDAELAALRAAGAAVTVLDEAAAAQPVAQIVSQLQDQMNGSGTLWVEAGPREAAPRMAGPRMAGPRMAGPREAGPRQAAPAQPTPPQAPADAPSMSSPVGAPPARPRRRFAATVGMLAGAAREAAVHGLTRRHLLLLPYLGYGSAAGLWVKGRVLQERAFGQQADSDSGWRNLAALYRRLESDEVAGEAVSASFAGQTYLTRTDSGGYFSFQLKAPADMTAGWLAVALALPDAPADSAVTASASVLVPGDDARFGVISDIDDTVLWTNVTNKLNMALMLARSNPYTRKPFKGVAAFYRALHEGARSGAGGCANNPLFYVSSSPWHLFGHLVEFLRSQGLPLGPLLLRELGLKQLFKLGQHGSHKLGKIEHILATYPRLPFVLIGDSGEQDPEIYAEVVRRHPGQVRVIYIRNVNPDPARIAALDRLIEEVAANGAEMVLAADSEAAARHAAALGLIDPARLADIRTGLRAETGADISGG